MRKAPMRIRMKIVLLSVITAGLHGNEHNTTNEHNSSIENNKTQEAIQKAIELEKKYAKEKRFYQGSEYDLKGKEIDPDTLKKIPVIKPDYDFDMDEGVYSD